MSNQIKVKAQCTYCDFSNFRMGNYLRDCKGVVYTDTPNSHECSREAQLGAKISLVTQLPMDMESVYYDTGGNPRTNNDSVAINTAEFVLLDRFRSMYYA